MKIIATFAALVTVLAASAASAQTVTETATGGGWVTPTGRTPSNATANFVTGSSGVNDFRSYLSFTVPASATPYTTATLRLNSRSVQDGPNRVAVREIANADPDNATPATLHPDLGDGPVFGISAAVSTDEIFTITLTAQGLAEVNAKRGSTVHLALTNADQTGPDDSLFGGSGGFGPRELILVATPPAAVPTMSEWAMILFGVALAGGAVLYVQRRQVV